MSAAQPAQARTPQVDDRMWADGVMYRFKDTIVGKVWAPDDRDLPTCHRLPGGAVLVATTEGLVQPEGALLPQVLTDDTPEPPRPWRVVDLDAPLDNWNSEDDQWSYVISLYAMHSDRYGDRPVYVIGGARD